MLFHESSISAMSSAKSKSHNDSSSVHVIPPVLLSMVLRSTQSMAIANSSGDSLDEHLHLKPTACVSIDPDCTATLLVKLLDDCSYLCWKPILLKDFPQRWSVNTVECLAEVDKVHYHGLTSFCHFLNDLS